MVVENLKLSIIMVKKNQTVLFVVALSKLITGLTINTKLL